MLFNDVLVLDGCALLLLLATLQVDVVNGVLQLLPIPPFKGDFIGKAFMDVLPSIDRRPSMADTSRRSTMMLVCS